MRNPFKPGAGHIPPYLAGRHNEESEFLKLLNQETILENIIITGLRGVGKTVFLEEMKKKTIQVGWKWIQNDMSESASLTEEKLAYRLIADLAPITSHLIIKSEEKRKIGFEAKSETQNVYLDYNVLQFIYNNQPGLVSDKLKGLLEFIWRAFGDELPKGIVFAYDEAQNLADHSVDNEYPLSVLLDVFQSIQRKNIPYLLVLTGLPTLFPKLVDARTYAERMFHIITLDHLTSPESRDAIIKPLEIISTEEQKSVSFIEDVIELIIEMSGGYPYFIQFISREVFDILIQSGEVNSTSLRQVLYKLDEDFFMGRWNRTTDREQDLLQVIAQVENVEKEFSIQDISNSKKIGMSNSQINQMLTKLTTKGIVYKNKHGKYSFAVPLMSEFIQRKFIKIN